nr:hypothetical protein [Tsuneonella deserti]
MLALVDHTAILDDLPVRARIIVFELQRELDHGIVVLGRRRKIQVHVPGQLYRCQIAFGHFQRKLFGRQPAHGYPHVFTVAPHDHRFRERVAELLDKCFLLLGAATLWNRLATGGLP